MNSRIKHIASIKDNSSKGGMLLYIYNYFKKFTNNTIDETKLRQDVGELIVNEGGYEFIWISYLDNNPRQIIPSGYTGNAYAYPAMLNSDYLNILVNNRSYQKVIDTGQFIIVNDDRNTSPNKNWHDELVKRGYNSTITLPLENKNGVLGINAKENHSFASENEIELMKKLVGDLVFGTLKLRRNKRLNSQKGGSIQTAVEYVIGKINDTKDWLKSSVTCSILPQEKVLEKCLGNRIS